MHLDIWRMAEMLLTYWSIVKLKYGYLYLRLLPQVHSLSFISCIAWHCHIRKENKCFHTDFGIIYLSFTLLFLIFRAPDTSKVREKMVYASSKDKFKRELDGIQVELQATDPSEMSFDIIKARAL